MQGKLTYDLSELFKNYLYEPLKSRFLKFHNRVGHFLITQNCIEIDTKQCVHDEFN